jgi:hypothetical protein
VLRLLSGKAAERRLSSVRLELVTGKDSIGTVTPAPVDGASAPKWLLKRGGHKRNVSLARRTICDAVRSGFV